MNFSYREDQQDLRRLTAQIFDDRLTDDFRRDFSRSGEPYDRSLWRTLAQAGLLGTAIAEAQGGSGLGLTELCLLLEEQGRTLAPVPLLATLVLGALPIQKFGSAAQQTALLPGVASGDLLLTAALEEIGGGDPSRPAVKATASAEGWRLRGVKSCVPYGAQAQAILVTARIGRKSTGVFLIDPQAKGVRIQPQATTSGEPQALVTLSNVRVPAADVLGDIQAGESIVDWIVERGQTALAAQQLGLMAEALRRTATYTGERVQFGRPIGSFQGVQHRLADAYIDVEALRSVYLRAVWALENDLPASAEVAVVKWWAARGGHRVTHTAQHLHGGLGADVDYPIHAFFLHAKQIELALGAAAPMLAKIGTQLASGAVRPLT
ncbi:acyl-CoA dehydrogenase [Steroidobacter denitrificans]|uniref:Acyl-CoA dehydrogenase n=1 Tax=Steroidobacter denitrificans TaxID=465721 RepID=A0A127F539_STEDE|nr:acyl-CoA dehydrogenase family protein [Steroidobacter denitrificans]AMN45552.1 acyl-CoA dehydrogenase [Steroidobacter denitrificans]